MATSAGPNVSNNGLVLCLDPLVSNTYSKNVHPKPTNIFDWFAPGTGGSNSCITYKDTTIVSPVGGNPLAQYITGTDPHTGCYNTAYYNIFPASQGQTWTISVYVKASGPTVNTGQFFMFGAPANGNAFDATFGEITSGPITFTQDWQRVSYTYTFTKPVSFIQVRLDGPDSAAVGQTIWWDGLQIENQPSMTTFDETRTTTAAIIDRFGNAIRPISGPIVNSTTGNITFNGTNQFFDTGKTGGDLGISDSSYTFDAWINPTTFTGTSISDRAIFGTRETTFGKGLHLVLRNGTIYQGHYSSDFAAGIATLNQWQNITWTYDRATKKPSIYKNGVLLGTPTGTIEPFTGSTNILIGDWYVVESRQPFAGTGSCFKIYNRALSATEISQNFNALRFRFGI